MSKLALPGLKIPVIELFRMPGAAVDDLQK